MTPRRKPKAEINVVPYIDVTLVLLIIFMITAPMLNTGVEVDLPTADSDVVSQQDQTPIIVTVDVDGRFYLTLDANGDQGPLPDHAMQETVLNALIATPKRPVLIRGDRQVDYGSVMTAMTLLKSAGIDKVGLLTQPSSVN
ncbi:MAG: protein TolR [Methylococcales bacterium]|nr:protein TolR [Methylococcales bacterium]